MSKMSSIKAEFIHYPRDEHEYRFVVDAYAAVGLPGCVGSVDCVHIGWDKCPTQHMNLYKGKVLFFVNDMLYVGSNDAIEKEFEDSVCNRFDVKFLGTAKWFL
jgi:hypothetical protein